VFATEKELISESVKLSYANTFETSKSYIQDPDSVDIASLVPSSGGKQYYSVPRQFRFEADHFQGNRGGKSVSLSFVLAVRAVWM
jgi:hypothetical protein